jgi:hypothetical protein
VIWQIPVRVALDRREEIFFDDPHDPPFAAETVTNESADHLLGPTEALRATAALVTGTLCSL